MPDCADDLEAGVLEQPRDPLAQQHRVVGEHDAHAHVPPRARAQRREVAAEAGLVELEDPLGLGQPGARTGPGRGARGRGASRRSRRRERGSARRGPPCAIRAGAVDLDADVAVLAECGGRPCGCPSGRAPARARCGPRAAAAPRARPARRSRRSAKAAKSSSPRESTSWPSAPATASRSSRRCPRARPASRPRARGRARRALDVGEEEGDGSGRERTHRPPV